MLRVEILLTVLLALGGAACSSSAKGAAPPATSASTPPPSVPAPLPTSPTTGPAVAPVGKADIQLITSDAASANALLATFTPGTPSNYGFTASDVTSGVKNDVYIWTDPPIRPADRAQLELMLLTIPGVVGVHFDVAPPGP